MVTLEVKKIRCADTLQELIGSGRCVFFTLTTPDVVDIHEIRRRWRNLRNWLVRKLGKGTFYVMNYEIHPNGHGWHIHSVWNRFIPLNHIRDRIRIAGFGRVDVRAVTNSQVSDYLTKHALKAYRGVSRKECEKNPQFRLRLVNCSRGLPRLSDYVYNSPHREKICRLMRPYIPKNELYGIPLSTLRKCGLSMEIQATRLSIRFFRKLHNLAEIGAMMDFHSIEDASSWLSRVCRLC